MNVTSMISDLFGEASFRVSFVARKQWFAGQSQWFARLTAKKQIFMFPAVHQIFIKVSKYLVNKCKSFS